MELTEIRKHKKILENSIRELIRDFQDKTDLNVKKIHLKVYRSHSGMKPNEFVNIILKGL